MIFKEVATEFLAQRMRSLDEPAVALPCLCIQQLLFLSLRQTFGFFALFLFIGFPVVIQPCFDLAAHTSEILKQRVAKLVVQFGADFLITRSEAKRLNRLDCESTMQTQWTFDPDLPITERLVWKDFGLFVFFERNV